MGPGLTGYCTACNIRLSEFVGYLDVFTLLMSLDRDCSVESAIAGFRSTNPLTASGL